MTLQLKDPSSASFVDSSFLPSSLKIQSPRNYSMWKCSFQKNVGIIFRFMNHQTISQGIFAKYCHFIRSIFHHSLWGRIVPAISGGPTQFVASRIDWVSQTIGSNDGNSTRCCDLSWDVKIMEIQTWTRVLNRVDQILCIRKGSMLCLYVNTMVYCPLNTSYWVKPFRNSWPASVQPVWKRSPYGFWTTTHYSKKFPSWTHWTGP